ncbi:hypothetical protein KDL67_11090 [bacterium]|nr:hypothetical protein [bacterium]
MTKPATAALLALLAFSFAAVPAAGAAGAAPVEDSFPVPPPPLSDGIFPCSDCHADLEPDPTPRVLGMHEEIAESFHHAEQRRWCLDCHNPDDRDKLRLANGQLIDFEHSYELCGQCHGTIYRDWKAGVHGKRTGYWNGRREYRLCVACHNPHHPRFAPIVPEPAPTRPGAIGNRNPAGVAAEHASRGER